jgi:D-lactate dehydrogenase (cytochrome)
MDTSLLNELKAIFKNKVYTDSAHIEAHTATLFHTVQQAPDVVCYPENEGDVMAVVDFCLQNNMALIPYGSGTSVEGHTAALNGGICLDMSKMKNVLEFNPQDGYVIVEPGLAYNELNDYLERYGYYFPVEAGWGASIGGMAATNASGAGAVDYGSMSRNVICAEVVTYDENKATKIKLGSLAPKSSAGYDLKSIFLGSEGTLGVFTSLGLKIRKKLSSQVTMTCQFASLKDAIDFVIETKKEINFRKVELLDQRLTAACICYSNVNYLVDSKCTVLLELAGNIAQVQCEKNIIIEYLQRKNINDYYIFEQQEEVRNVWMMRKYACQAAIAMYGENKKIISTDVSVPMSKLFSCIEACYRHMDNMQIMASLVAHVGDGNFHFIILVDPEDDEVIHLAHEFHSMVINEGLNHNGTCTGEHGIGLGKKGYLHAEKRASYFLMQRVKMLFDPKNIFNPGKVLLD